MGSKAVEVRQFAGSGDIAYWVCVRVLGFGPWDTKTNWVRDVWVWVL